MNNFEIFMKNLKQLREIYGLNKTDLSRKTGIPRSSITGYEKGSNEPTLSVIAKIADAFDISIQTLTTQDISSITLGKDDKSLLKEIDKSLQSLEGFSDPLLNELFSKGNLNNLKNLKDQYMQEIERLNDLANNILPHRIKIIEKIIKLVESEIE